MPTKKQMQTVIDNLKKVLPWAIEDSALDMRITTIHESCGTVHCFGGWYAIATLEKKEIHSYSDFYLGVIRMAKDLGFDKPSQLDTWAFHNTLMWGNHRGGNMFTSCSAFYHAVKRPRGAKNLQHIIDHLEEVRDRLPA